MDALTYDRLSEAVAGGAVALRSRVRLEPAGGPEDKLMPPTYGSDGRDTKYPLEKRRRRDGESVASVVLDSVAAQANALEEALLGAVRGGEAAVPLVSVDFRGDERTAHLGVVSSMEAPHRVYDALLRDSLDGDVLFRLGDVGRAITEATTRDAGALLHWAPTTLLFGGWDSTGPRGGRGSKFERAITGEVVAYGVELGLKTSSRIDPAGIEKGAATLYATADGDPAGWTLDPDAAKKEKDKPIPYGTGTDRGRPSQVNHGNVAPSIDGEAGGVTADHVEAVTVLSLAALRRLRFPRTYDGQQVDDVAPAETAARAALAALGVAALVLSHEEGYDLRSRCVLYAPEPLQVELLVSGQPPQPLAVGRQDALDLMRQAAERLREVGLGWSTDEVVLTPTERLAELVGRSRALAERAPAGAE